MSDVDPGELEGADHTVEEARSESQAKHRSLEKTDCDLGKELGENLPEPTADAEEASTTSEQADLPTDADLLREKYLKKQRECSSLDTTVEELRTQIEALRSDFTVQRDEYATEIRTLKEVIEKAQGEYEAQESEIDALKQDNKQLKAQNLSLQYHLNLWGIPVSTGESSGEDMDGTDPEEKAFFPKLAPLQGGEDPIPVSLRGELSVLSFPDLLHFLANTQLRGVVTVVAEGIVSKLYLEGPVLRIAGWNSRDPDLGLLTLLQDAELLPADACQEFRERELFDWELASSLLTEQQAPPETIRLGLREHARVVLSYLFQLKRGSFFFQSGEISRKRELQFQLLITDVLLKTAAEMDEKTRELLDEALGG